MWWQNIRIVVQMISISKTNTANKSKPFWWCPFSKASQSILGEIFSAVFDHKWNFTLCNHFSCHFIALSTCLFAWFPCSNKIVCNICIVYLHLHRNNTITFQIIVKYIEYLDYRIQRQQNKKTKINTHTKHRIYK